METTLERDVTAVPSRLVAEIAEVVMQAAIHAVEDVPEEIEALGGSRAQGRAVAEAVKMYLLREPDRRERARRILIDGGFGGGNIDLLLAKIDAGTGR